MTKTAENGKVCVAMITTAHGVRGLVKVKSYTKQARDFASYGALSDESDKRSFKAEIVGQTGDVFLVRLDGISDRTAAEALRGVKLFVNRKALPETSDNEFYYADLIGMTAKTADGEILGKVKGVYNFGAGDMLEIGNLADFLPFTDSVVPEVDVEHNTLTVVLPEFVEVKPEKQDAEDNG